ncbi:hypothetical protein [Brachybacterium tyrofermentans]|uniref:hypothetical protein n=1 Tax=Brachybacterium tyrofermentans TaxID=47848 RepID=UPI001868DD79|nr:hypothetical protein [Brachybacterium tyrofermentans]
MSTAHARHADPITSHEAAATVDTNRSQTAVLQLAHQYLGDYFTQAGAVATYQQVSRHHEDEQQQDALPRLSESRVRSAVRELQRKGHIAHAGYTDPPTGRREAIWELTETGEQ